MSLTKKIERFCEAEDITIPSGFYRHSPSRYVVIVNTGSNWKLIAKTWFSVQDLVYYIDNNLNDREFRMFDFQTSRELTRRDKRSVSELRPLDL